MAKEKSLEQRSLEKLQEWGYTATITQYYDKRTYRKHDLFGFVDVMGAHPEEMGFLLVQVTDPGHMKARIKKIYDSPHLEAILAAGNRVVVHTWQQIPNTDNWSMGVIEIKNGEAASP